MTELKIKDLLSVDDPQGTSYLDDAADQIWVWDTTRMTWKRYYYNSFRGTPVGWCREEESEETEDTIKNGDGFFFRRSGNADGNITISGALKTTSTAPVALTADRLHFICNPWPVEIGVNEFYTKELIDDPQGVNELDDAADQIWMWNTSKMNWDRYYFNAFRGTPVGWCKEGESEPTNAKIGVGQGFFFRRSGNGDATLTWKKPF